MPCVKTTKVETTPRQRAVFESYLTTGTAAGANPMDGNFFAVRNFLTAEWCCRARIFKTSEFRRQKKQPAGTARKRRKDLAKNFWRDTAAAIRTGIFRRLGQDMNLQVASENDENRNDGGSAPHEKKSVNLRTDDGAITLKKLRPSSKSDSIS